MARPWHEWWYYPARSLHHKKKISEDSHHILFWKWLQYLHVKLNRQTFLNKFGFPGNIRDKFNMMNEKWYSNLHKLVDDSAQNKFRKTLFVSILVPYKDPCNDFECKTSYTDNGRLLYNLKLSIKWNVKNEINWKVLKFLTTLEKHWSEILLTSFGDIVNVNQLEWAFNFIFIAVFLIRNFNIKMRNGSKIDDITWLGFICPNIRPIANVIVME